MKKTLLIVVAVLAILAVVVTVFNVGATDAENPAIEQTEVSTAELEATEALPESETPLIDSEAVDEIVSIFEQADSKPEAIIALAEKLGITTEEAEALINAVIVVGDETFGDNDWWVVFKQNVQEDMQFWAIAIVVIIAALSIFCGIFVLLAKTNPTMKKTLWKMTQMRQDTEIMSTNISETLVNLKDQYAVALEKEAFFEQLLAEKEEKIAELTSKIKDIEEAGETDRLNMLNAEMYILRMIKLICDRTAMPLTDKATIDLFYTKGIESLTSGLTEEDIDKIEKTISTLDSVGGDLS